MSGNEWLDDLKVGDKVCYHSRWRGYEFEIIEKITPTGQIKTKRHTFKNGYCKLDTWDGLHLQPITQIILDTVRAKQLLSEIENFKFVKLNLEQLETVHAVIKGFAQSAIKATEQPSGAAAEEEVYGNDCKDDSCS